VDDVGEVPGNSTGDWFLSFLFFLFFFIFY
jgi:hypothetical protein